MDVAHSAFCFVKLLKKIIIIIIRRHFFCDVFALCRFAVQGGGVKAAVRGQLRGAVAVVCRAAGRGDGFRMGGCVGRLRGGGRVRGGCFAALLSGGTASGGRLRGGAPTEKSNPRNFRKLPG